MQVPLSHDLTAELDNERQRVLDAGGTVSRQRGFWRIGDIGLMVTRYSWQLLGTAMIY